MRTPRSRRGVAHHSLAPAFFLRAGGAAFFAPFFAAFGAGSAGAFARASRRLRTSLAGCTFAAPRPFFAAGRARTGAGDFAAGIGVVVARWWSRSCGDRRRTSLTTPIDSRPGGGAPGRPRAPPPRCPMPIAARVSRRRAELTRRPRLLAFAQPARRPARLRRRARLRSRHRGDEDR